MTVRLTVELGKGVSGAFGPAPSVALQTALDRELERLGIGDNSVVEVNAADSARTVRFVIDGRVLVYPAVILVQSWISTTTHEQHTAACAGTRLDRGFPDGWLADALKAGDPNAAERFLVEAMLAVVRQRPSCLLTAAAVQRFGLNSPLHELLDLGVTLADGDGVRAALGAATAYDLPSHEVAELAYAALREPTADLLAHPDQLETLGWGRIDTPRWVWEEGLSDDFRTDVETFEREFFETHGLRTPRLRCVPRTDFEQGEFEVRVLGCPGRRVPGLPAGTLFIDAPASGVRALGIAALQAIHPATGKEGALLQETDAATAQSLGKLLDGTGLMFSVLAWELRNRSASLLTVTDVDGSLAALERGFPAIVRALATIMPTADIVRILRLLAAEGVSIRDLRVIADRLLEYDGLGLDVRPEAYADFVRRGLPDLFADRHAPEGRLDAIRIDPELELRLDEGAPLTPADEETLRDEVWDALASLVAPHAVALLTTNRARRPVHDAVAPELPGLPVLARDELPLGVAISRVATVGTRVATTIA